MAAPIKPAVTKAFGRERVNVITTIADTTDYHPTLAEWNAGSSYDITCYLLGEQAAPDLQQGSVNLPRLLCETKAASGPDVANWQPLLLQVTYNPQAAAASSGKKAAEVLAEGSQLYIGRRLGPLVDVDPASGQFVDIFYGEIGAHNTVKTSSDASGLVVRQFQFFIEWAELDRIIDGAESSSSSSSSS